MLRRAVTLGPPIGVLVALNSTIEPTTCLLAEEAADAETDITVEVSVVEGAWDAFLAGSALGPVRPEVSAMIASLAEQISPEVRALTHVPDLFAGSLAAYKPAPPD